MTIHYGVMAFSRETTFDRPKNYFREREDNRNQKLLIHLETIEKIKVSNYIGILTILMGLP